MRTGCRLDDFRKGTPVTLLAMTILLLLFTEPASAALNRWTGTHWTSAGRAAAIRALGAVVLVALIFSLDPEVRVFLFFVDAVGVDIFLMLLLFQGREILHWLNVATRFPVIRVLETRGWYPMPLPHRALLKQHPWWSLYAAARPIAMALLVSLPIIALLRSLRDTLI
jgi:hypothetical protein